MLKGDKEEPEKGEGLGSKGQGQAGPAEGTPAQQTLDHPIVLILFPQLSEQLKGRGVTYLY